MSMHNFCYQILKSILRLQFKLNKQLKYKLYQLYFYFHFDFDRNVFCEKKIKSINNLLIVLIVLIELNIE